MKKHKFLSMFLLGFLLGLALMNLFHSHTLDRLYRMQKQLTTQLLDKEIKLERFTQKAIKEDIPLIKDLNILIEFDGNVLIKDAIERNIRFYLSDLVGREVSEIDGEMIYKIFHNRILQIEGKEMKVTVKYLIINEVITISVVCRIVD
ncbi:hypothetical protein [Alkaliphilus serpentinus]|uniref:Sporulation membrane protein YtrI C-terminal domain-containing protein n=1 Tax=Alkaliphilus serpentinus TaxID=1482731 RepID=A0A833HQF4_9FIRM|nr:hypothetical protein [Alkaliphilus serpentinus]KAB3531829.1 hypothetical protein F8153_03680 [Alkaliphilus serpentinus]